MTAQDPVPSVRFASIRGLFRRLRAGIARLDAAHEARRRHLAVSDRDLMDVGLSRDDVVGVSSHQPLLPFFLQHGFTSHRL
jgi:uncharacterized protein YjiS (DUF1127 family)